MSCISFVTLLNCSVCNVVLFVSAACCHSFLARFETVKGGGVALEVTDDFI
jgi:hypothetical protein